MVSPSPHRASPRPSWDSPWHQISPNTCGTLHVWYQSAVNRCSMFRCKIRQREATNASEQNYGTKQRYDSRYEQFARQTTLSSHWIVLHRKKIIQ